nr:MAG TPA: hypothetical protein [Caudoviricetes sp.]
MLSQGFRVQHRSVPLRAFNHTPQCGRFGFTPTGAYLFLSNVAFVMLRVINQGLRLLANPGFSRGVIDCPNPLHIEICIDNRHS